MLEIQKLESIIGQVRVLDNVSLAVAESEFVCVLGPSGCGKSTLLNTISGFLPVKHGRILIDGASASELPPHKRPTAMVFQNYALFPHLSIFDNIAFGLRMRRVNKQTIQRKVVAALDLVKLVNVGDRYPKQLSGGQQQRVALARALVLEPKVLLLDEPFSSLDAKLREMMRIDLKLLQKNVGITTLFVTHDQEEAFDLGDRVVLMNNGRIEQVGTASDLYERPRTMFVATFIGRANILRGTIRHRSTNRALVSADGMDIQVSLAEGEAGDLVHLVLRPEQIAITASRPEAANVFAGRVKWASHLGSGIRHVVDIGSHTLTALNPNLGQGLLAVGDSAYVSFGTDLRAVPASQAERPEAMTENAIT